MAALAVLQPALSAEPNLRSPVHLELIKALRFAAIIGCLWVNCLVSSQALAVDSEDQVQIESDPDLVSLIQSAQQNIQRLNSLIAKGDTTVATHVAEELRLWEELELVVSQRRSTKEDIAALEQSAVESDQAALIAADQPESYLDLDDLRDLVILKRQQLESLQSELHAEKAMLVSAKHRHQEAEQQRRRLTETLQETGARDKTNLLREQSIKALASQLLASRLDLGREQVAMTAKRLDALKRDLTRIDGILSANAGKFQLTQSELDSRLRRISDIESGIWDQLTDVNERMRVAMRHRSSDASVANETAYQVAHEESELLQQILSEVNSIRDCWQKRFRLSNGKVSASEIVPWLEEIKQAKQRLSHITQKLSHRSSQRQLSLSSLNRAKFDVPGSNSTPGTVSEPECKR